MLCAGFYAFFNDTICEVNMQVFCHPDNLFYVQNTYYIYEMHFIIKTTHFVEKINICRQNKYSQNVYFIHKMHFVV